MPAGSAERTRAEEEEELFGPDEWVSPSVAGVEVAEEAPSSTKSPKKRSAVSTAEEVGKSKRGMSSAGAGWSATLPPPPTVSRKPATKAEDLASTESEVELTSGQQRFRRESDLIATSRIVWRRLGQLSCHQPQDLRLVGVSTGAARPKI